MNYKHTDSGILAIKRNTVKFLYNEVLGASEIIRYTGHFLVKVAQLTIEP